MRTPRFTEPQIKYKGANQAFYAPSQKVLNMSSVTPKMSLLLATVAVAGMILLGYAHITHTHETAQRPVMMDVKSEPVVVTGFRDLNASTSNFGVSFRPVQGAKDYVLEVYETDMSSMPLQDVRWSANRCRPYDERDYCIDSGTGLTTSSEWAQLQGMLPYWFSIVAIFPDREIESERFCFDGVPLDASLCPDSEKNRLQLVRRERDGEFFIRRNAQ